MKKNEIINNVVTSLLSQRETLNLELSLINHNDPSYIEKRLTLENQLREIDIQIDKRILDCELQ